MVREWPRGPVLAWGGWGWEVERSYCQLPRHQGWSEMCGEC